MARLLSAATFAGMCAITISIAADFPLAGPSMAAPAAAATIDVYKDAG